MAGPIFAPNLERLFNEGKADLTDSEARIYNLWVFTKKGFKPWEVEADYADNERLIKLEDKADILKCDQFEFNAAKNANKKKDGIQQFGLESAQHMQPQKSLFDSSSNPLSLKKDLVFD